MHRSSEAPQRKAEIWYALLLQQNQKITVVFHQPYPVTSLAVPWMNLVLPPVFLTRGRMQNDLPKVQWQDVGRTDEMGDCCGLQIYMWLQCLINALCSPKAQFRMFNWLKWVPSGLLSALLTYCYFGCCWILLRKVTPNPSIYGPEHLGLTPKYWHSELLATF